MNEHELDELLDLDDMKEMKSVNKRLKKKMWKKIVFSVVIVIVCLSIVTVAGFHGTSQVVKQMYYNPLKEEELIKKEEYNLERNDCSFEVLMSTFISMEFPGYFYYQIGTENTIDNDFGKYVINGKIQNKFDYLNYDNDTNTKFIIEKSEMKVESVFRPSRLYNEYRFGFYEYGFDAIGEDTLQEIKDLPKSAYLDVSLTFDDVYNAKEVIEFIRSHKDVRFEWLALQPIDGVQIAEGINLFANVRYELLDEMKEKYPTFYLENNYTEDDLLENYLSNLKMLIDHEEFVEVISSWYPNVNVNILKQRYDHAKENGIQAIGIKCYIQRDDLIHLIEEEGFKYMQINDAKFSQFER